ncbi:MAG: histidine kinase [Flavobacteriales bacterium]|nr:histidine kinase [Flavobacteriales bacterium]MCW8912532.1 histidine kinase [Flavobacteriales bacterium]MCW8937558.1 histidine kinase [Flavobacteriales bacterium]MCW8939599.1 histidine kinase [Flavobacteriales bacterium]MCW8968785.1 histidine kinase [Flavobacteriales bacterium]
MLRFIIIIQLVIFSEVLFAQNPSFSNYKSSASPYLQFNDIIEHKNKMLFISSEGIFEIKNNNLTKIITEENLSKFIKTPKNLYVWSIYGEIFEIKNNQLVPFPFNKLVQKRVENKIINSVIFADSAFYISTIVGSALIQIDLKTETISNLKLNPYPYFVVKFNGKLISGNNQNTSKNELFVNTNSNSFNIPLAEAAGNSRTNVVQLQDKTYLFSKQHEVIRFNNTTFLNRIFVEKNVEFIFQDSQGKIWFALNSGGIISYADGSLKEANITRYLGNQTVISVAEDTKGNLWFGTSGNGVFKLENEFEHIDVNSTITYSSPAIFSSTEIENEKVQSKFILKNLPVDQQTEKPINSKTIRTDRVRQDSLPPSVFINSVKINGKDTTTLSHYELSHENNAIEFNISGISNSPSGIQYKYILEGFDKEWIYTVNTSIYYTSLAPGSYTFKVFAMNDSGIWSTVPSVISFTIQPPFYMSAWFLLTLVFGVIIIGFLIYFLIQKQNQLKNKQIEEQKQRALASELQALRSQMNPHFIFNTLNSIQNFISKNESKDASIYLSKFAKLMRATLANTKRQRISLKDEIETLTLYLELEQLRLNNKFSYEILVDETIDTQYEQIPSMLIQPYVENAIWHGISHKEGNGIIRIQFLLENEHLLKCVVEDNGIGRENAIKLKQNTTSPSFGMNITKERVELLNSLNGNRLSVKINDLKINNQPAGTRVELYVPI